MNDLNKQLKQIDWNQISIEKKLEQFGFEPIPGMDWGYAYEDDKTLIQIFKKYNRWEVTLDMVTGNTLHFDVKNISELF